MHVLQQKVKYNVYMLFHVIHVGRDSWLRWNFQQPLRVLKVTKSIIFYQKGHVHHLHNFWTCPSSNLILKRLW